MAQYERRLSPEQQSTWKAFVSMTRLVHESMEEGLRSFGEICRMVLNAHRRLSDPVRAFITTEG